jgi:lysozyme
MHIAMWLLGCALLVACTTELDEDAAAGDGLTEEDKTADDGKEDGASGRRACPSGTTTLGIDVSYFQGTIDWARVRSAGARFAWIRVSYGAGFKDPKFASNWTGSKRAGVVRGAYQYFRPDQSVTRQADLMIAAVGKLDADDLPPVLDVETDGGLAPATLASRTRQWAERVAAATGKTPIIYTGRYFWRDEVGGATVGDSDLWIAHYTRQSCPTIPRPWGTWAFWQYTDRGSIAGIRGAVDLNHFNGSADDLAVFARGRGGDPAPVVDLRSARP